MTEKEVKEYLRLIKQLEPYEDKLHSFGLQYMNFASRTYVETPLGKWLMANYTHGGELIKVYINEVYTNEETNKIVIEIEINEFEDGITFVELPADILWDKNWKERAKELKLAEWNDIIKAKLKAREAQKTRKEEEERKEYERLKAKYETA